MKEKMIKWKDTAATAWTSRSKSQKGVFIGSALIIIMLIAGIALVTSSSNLVPLYNNLSLQESGQISEELDARSIPYEIEDGGTTITVPEQQVDTLMVDLAGQGIPNSGNIDYSFFSENSSWGITDNEFDIMRLDAMQTELGNLMQGIDGIESAEVMIDMPEDPVFASETTQESSASIVLNTQPGYQFEGNQIESLYHLVSSAIPNLPDDNVVIMNQHFEYFDRDSQTAQGNQDSHTYQQTVKQDVERDIQRRLQQMLGTMVGADNIIVSVTADIDFTQENREEELIEPVDIENIEGVPISIESIQESYSGNPDAVEVVGTGEEDIPGMQEIEGDDGEYELERETINNEYNRIRRDIVESPYKVRDLGVQVAVDSVTDSDGDDIQYLTQQEETTVEAGISSILDSVIGTSISEEFGEVVPEDNFSIVFQEFSGTTATPETTTPIIPTWLYVTGAILLAIIILLAFLLFRNRNEDEEEFVEEDYTTEITEEVPEIEEQQQDSESVTRRKELEKIARDKPEDFAKLLRSWIGDD